MEIATNRSITTASYPLLLCLKSITQMLTECVSVVHNEGVRQLRSLDIWIICEKTGQSLFEGRFSVEEVNKTGNEISNTACAPRKPSLMRSCQSVLALSPSLSLEVDNLAISRALDTGMVSPWKYPAPNLPELEQ